CTIEPALVAAAFRRASSVFFSPAKGRQNLAPREAARFGPAERWVPSREGSAVDLPPSLKSQISSLKLDRGRSLPAARQGPAVRALSCFSAFAVRCHPEPNRVLASREGSAVDLPPSLKSQISSLKLDRGRSLPACTEVVKSGPRAAHHR